MSQPLLQQADSLYKMQAIIDEGLYSQTKQKLNVSAILFQQHQQLLKPRYPGAVKIMELMIILYGEQFSFSMPPCSLTDKFIAFVSKCDTSQKRDLDVVANFLTLGVSRIHESKNIVELAGHTPMRRIGAWITFLQDVIHYLFWTKNSIVCLDQSVLSFLSKFGLEYSNSLIDVKDSQQLITLAVENKELTEQVKSLTDQISSLAIQSQSRSQQVQQQPIDQNSNLEQRLKQMEIDSEESVLFDNKLQQMLNKNTLRVSQIEDCVNIVKDQTSNISAQIQKENSILYGDMKYMLNSSYTNVTSTLEVILTQTNQTNVVLNFFMQRLCSIDSANREHYRSLVPKNLQPLKGPQPLELTNRSYEQLIKDNGVIPNLPQPAVQPQVPLVLPYVAQTQPQSLVQQPLAQQTSPFDMQYNAQQLNVYPIPQSQQGNPYQSQFQEGFMPEILLKENDEQVDQNQSNDVDQMARNQQNGIAYI